MVTRGKSVAVIDGFKLVNVAVNEGVAAFWGRFQQAAALGEELVQIIEPCESVPVEEILDLLVALRLAAQVLDQQQDDQP